MTLVSKQVYAEVHHIFFTKQKFLVAMGSVSSSFDTFTKYENALPFTRKLQLRERPRTVMLYSLLPWKPEWFEMDIDWSPETLTAQIQTR